MSTSDAAEKSREKRSGQPPDHALVVDLGAEDASAFLNSLPEGMPVLRIHDGGLQETRTPVGSEEVCHPVCCSERPDLVDRLVKELRERRGGRVSLLPHPESAETAVVRDALAEAGIPHELVDVSPGRVSDADFIPADEADEVAARLRELGYL